MISKLSLERLLLLVCASFPSLRVNEGSRASMVSSFGVGVLGLEMREGPAHRFPLAHDALVSSTRPVVADSCYPGFIPRVKNRRLRDARCPHPHASRLVVALLILF